MTFQYKTGQSLTEYSLVMGLVALACIGGVAVLGTQIQNQLGNSLGTTPVQTAVTNPTTLNALAAPFSKQQGFFLTSQEIQQILAQSPTETLDLGNGKSITIPKPNFPELQETLGPNGSTELALALVQRIQEAMRKEGLDPETVIPELSMFANEGHRVSGDQRRIESDILSKGRAFAMLSISSRERQRTEGNIKFLKNPNGEIEVQNYLTNSGSFDGAAKKLNSFSNREKVFLTSELVKQTLRSRPDLKGLTQPFSNISETILSASETLGFVATNVTESRTPEKKAAFMEKYPWYQTKKAANDACIMSKDEGCIQ